MRRQQAMKLKEGDSVWDRAGHELIFVEIQDCYRGLHPAPDAQPYGFSVRVRKKYDVSYDELYDLLDDEFYLWSNAVSVCNMSKYKSITEKHPMFILGVFFIFSKKSNIFQYDNIAIVSRKGVVYAVQN